MTLASYYLCLSKDDLRIKIIIIIIIIIIIMIIIIIIVIVMIIIIIIIAIMHAARPLGRRFSLRTGTS
jgi:hypothetical protein